MLATDRCITDESLIRGNRQNLAALLQQAILKIAGRKTSCKIELGRSAL
jgi:hypothetical protein